MPHIGEERALLSAPVAKEVIALGASPATFTAVDRGTLVVQAGTVSNIELGRGGVFVSAGVVAGCIPVARGDQVRVTYAVAPTTNYFRG